MAKTYWEKLQDPRWQRRRLEVFDAADFTCQLCGRSDQQLHAHHGCYLRGREPWDYELDQFHCLCNDCHKAVGSKMEQIYSLIARVPACKLCSLAVEVNELINGDKLEIVLPDWATQTT